MSGPSAGFSGLKVVAFESRHPGAAHALIRARGGQALVVPADPGGRFPEDPLPLRAAVRELAAGRADAALFTSPLQVTHAVRMAVREELWSGFRRSFGRTLLGAAGRATARELGEFGLEPDVTASGLAPLIRRAAASAGPRLAAKRAGAPARARALNESPFLRACRRQRVPFTPVWLMRQAGRYMKEYRLLREQVGFLELCRDPGLAADVTVSAAERLGVDAAIIFSDLLVVTGPLGFPVKFEKGEGPSIRRPVRRAADVDRVRPFAPARELPWVYEAIRRTRAALRPGLPLIGFAGAPFTIAAYLIEGGSSRTFERTRAFMRDDEGAWHALLGKLAPVLAGHLNGQLAAGAQAVQVFDSWVGCLSPDEYRRYVFPHTRALLRGIRRGSPVIHFGTRTGPLLELIRDAGGTVIGVDHRTPLDEARRRLGTRVAVQGNLDPDILLGSLAGIRAGAKRVLAAAGRRPGHIFNLGHGVLPPTPAGNAKALVNIVHELSVR
ncbi:MAG: uroporphyrinogen decarboxylase [Candidatus Coatesbacteria bacterium]